MSQNAIVLDSHVMLLHEEIFVEQDASARLDFKHHVAAPTSTLTAWMTAQCDQHPGVLAILQGQAQTRPALL